MLRPTGNYVILAPINEPTTPGGIVLPANQVRFFGTATVVAVGPGTSDKDGFRIPVDVEEGERVRFLAKHAMELEDNLLLIDSSAIVAVVE
jgi:chaperonin GroES